jgi:hypothetical protein
MTAPCPSAALAEAGRHGPATPQRGTDTREMLVVHSAFRREFRLAAGVVRAATPGDLARAKVVSEHLTLMTTMLHHHHHNEDALLWAPLLERVSAADAPTVLLMEAQHERMAAHLDAVDERVAAFAAHPGVDAQVALADALDRAYELLVEHLDAEETRLLPLAGRLLTEAEWAQLGEQGNGGIPKSRLPLCFGMMMYEGEPEVITHMLASAPWLMRKLVPILGRRAYTRYALKIHGTPTP